MVSYDVLESILSKCNVTDLLRYKSVCKPWYSMISSPCFRKTHARAVCSQDEKENLEEKRKICMIKASRTLFIHGVKAKQGEYQFYGRWFMGGSSNGLVCLFSRTDSETQILVTNPLTREFRLLPLPPQGKPTEVRCIGFGYDLSSADFKVVLARSSDCGLSIFCLQSGEWKELGIVKYKFNDISLGVPGILYNGSLHWLWLRHNFDTSKPNIALVAFDLAKENLREIPQPQDKRYVWNTGHRLGTTQSGHLCIFPSYTLKEEDDLGIWVMKSYNMWERIEVWDIEKQNLHYMIKDSDEDRPMPPIVYYTDENVLHSFSMEYIPCPMFVRTIVSPNIGGSMEFQSLMHKGAEGETTAKKAGDNTGEDCAESDSNDNEEDARMEASDSSCLDYGDSDDEAYESYDADLIMDELLRDVEDEDLDDEFVPRWLNKFKRQRMRKLGKKVYPKMKKSKRAANQYYRPGCAGAKFQLCM